MENKKLRVWNKIWYSITKLKKYPEMAEQGWKEAIKYLIILMIIFGAISSIFATHSTLKYVKETHNYLSENIPECEYKEGILTANNEEKIELYNDFIATNFGGKIIIDTKAEDESKINQDIEELESKTGYILLKDKIIVANFNKENPKEEYTYSDFYTKYFGTEIKEFNKQDILDYIEAKGQQRDYLAYYLEYVLVYGLAYLLVFSIIILTATVIIFIVSKIIKLRYKIAEILSYIIYAFTLPILLYIIYLIFNYFTNIGLPVMELIFVLLGIIYSVVAIYKNK